MAINLNIVSKFDQKGLKRAQESLRKFGKSALKATGAAIAAVGAVGVQGVRAFVDFDEKMNQSLAIMGDVSDAMRDDMAEAAREVGRETRFGADEAAEAYFFLASAGLDAAQSIEAMPQVAQFAQAGMFDMARATDLLTDAQSALGLTSDDSAENIENMARMSDVLVKANTLANASVEQFSEALTNKAAASMRSLNIPLEEGVAVLATFADQGIKGSQAGTTFNAMIRGLTQGIEKNADKFEDLNIEVFDAEGNFNNLADIVQDMEGALAGMSVEQQRAELSQLGFTEETLNGILALMGNSEAIKQFESDLEGAAGTTEEVAGNQLESLKGQLDLLKGRFEDLGLSIGETLEPSLVAFVDGMGPVFDELEPVLINLFETLAPVVEELIAELPGLIEAFVPLVPIIGDLTLLFLALIESTLPVFMELMEALEPAISSFTGFLAENGEVVGALIVTFALLRAAVLLTTGAMGLFAGSNVAAAGTSKGLFAVLARHPILALITAASLAGIAFIEMSDSAVKSGDDSAGAFIGLAKVMLGFHNFILRFAQAVVDTINAALLGGLGIALKAYNDAMDALGGKKIDIGLDLIPDVNMDTELNRWVTSLEIAAGDIQGSGSPAGEQRAQTGARLGGLIGDIGAMQVQQDQLIRDMDNMGNADIFNTPLQADGSVNYNIYVDAGLGVNGNRLGEEITGILGRYDREAGPVFEKAR